MKASSLKIVLCFYLALTKGDTKMTSYVKRQINHWTVDDVQSAHSSLACSLLCNKATSCTAFDYDAASSSCELASPSDFNIDPVTGKHWYLNLDAMTTDCSEVMALKGNNYQAGVYAISINGIRVEVYCDSDGYTTIQSRGDFGNPQDYFFRTWSEYLEPFGTPGEEVWLGLDNIYYMTNQKQYSLKINAQDVDGDFDYATWDTFRLTEDVRLNIRKYITAEYLMLLCRLTTLWKSRVITAALEAIA